MTFEEWFNEQYPEDSFSKDSPIREQWYQLCKSAWEASRENLRSWDV
jgi:hypothetical protein